MEQACAAVISKTFPKAEDLLFRSVGNAFDAGKAFYPAQKKGNASFHLRLLQHDFRNPYFIGIIAAAPRKRAHAGFEPCEKPVREFFDMLCWKGMEHIAAHLLPKCG